MRPDGMQILNLFPTPVWARQLDPETMARIARDSLALIETYRASAKTNQEGGWETPTNLQDHPELAELMACARETAEGALEDLGVEHEGFLATGCWANVKPRGAGHPKHIHPNNFLSGVYYVRAPGAGGNIIFHDPRSQPFVMAPRTRTRNQYNSRNADLAAREGLLLLFPAWLNHSVAGNSGEEERISISFNFMFKQFGETLAQPKWGSQYES